MKLKELLENKFIQDVFGRIKPSLHKFTPQFTRDEDELYDDDKWDNQKKRKYYRMGKEIGDAGRTWSNEN